MELESEACLAIDEPADQCRTETRNDEREPHTGRCAGSPEPRVRFRSFGDSALDFELLGWIEEPVLRGRVLHALNREVYRRFNEEGVEIPFPQRDVHLYPAQADAGG